MSGLYLHIPYCLRKCHYCDFFSTEVSEEALHEYVALLIRHLQWAATQGWQRPLHSIYFGGGTPSLLAPGDISRILSKIYRLFPVMDDAEISLEANPGTVTRDSLSGYRSAGINRLSLGLQSSDDQLLKELGRPHTSEEGMTAVSLAREAGFDNISLDLMFALPGQSLAELEGELTRYLEYNPEHMSCYGLTAEPGTKLFELIEAKKLSLPEEDLYADAYLMIHERLTTAGYEHYEIANYARDDLRCRHNEAYWQRKPYLGIGAGAHSFFDDGWGSRWQVPANLQKFRNAINAESEPMEKLEAFSRDAALSESVYLALRTRNGVNNKDLLESFGTTLEEAFPDAVADSSQWLHHENEKWSFTAEGWLLFDRLILPFL